MATTRNPPTPNPSSENASGGRTSNVQLPRRFRGPDRKEGWRHHPGQHAFGIRTVLLRGKPQRDLRVGVVTTPEERQPLNVVPVQVGQEDAAFERLPFQQGRDLSEPGAGVEQQRGLGRARGRGVLVERECDARCVAAVVDELGPGSRSRSASTAEMDPHPLSIAPDLRGGAPPRAREDPSAPTGRPRPWPPGRVSRRRASTCGHRLRDGRARRGGRPVRTRPAARRRARPG